MLGILFLPLSGLWSLRKKCILVMTFLYLSFTWVGGINSHAASVAACNSHTAAFNPLENTLRSVGARPLSVALNG